MRDSKIVQEVMIATLSLCCRLFVLDLMFVSIFEERISRSDSRRESFLLRSNFDDVARSVVELLAIHE